jgi:O-antigen ligase
VTSSRYPIVGYYGTAVLFWLLLAQTRWMSIFGLPGWNSSGALWLGIFLFLAFVICAVQIPWRHYVYLIATFVPLEFRSSLHALPVLSPIDYFCGGLVLATVWRLRQTLHVDVIRTFDPVGLACWVSFIAYGLLNASFQNGDIRPVLRWGEFLVCYFWGFQAVTQSPDMLKQLGRLLAVLGSLIAVLAIIQFIQGNAYYMNVKTIFGQHNITAAFLNIAFPVSLAWFQPLSYLIGAALILCYSRGAWVGLITGLVVMWMYKKGIWHRTWQPSPRTGLLLAVVVLLLFCTMTGGGRPFWSGRDFFLTAGLSVLREHPWIGLGPGNYAQNIASYLSGQLLELYQADPTTWMHLHSFYLQTLVEYGLLGGVFLFTALGRMTWKAWRGHLHAPLGFYWMISVIAFWMHNLVDVLMVNSLDLLFALILAALAVGPIYKGVPSHVEPQA